MIRPLNSVLLEGSLAADPRGETAPEGTRVCRFYVASDDFLEDDGPLEKKETGEFEVEARSQLGQTCLTILKAGRDVRVVGRLKQVRWETMRDHGPEPEYHSKIIIVAEHIELKPAFKEGLALSEPG